MIDALARRWRGGDGDVGRQKKKRLVQRTMSRNYQPDLARDVEPPSSLQYERQVFNALQTM